MRKVEGEVLGGILITRIPAGAKVGWHVDKSWAVSYHEKFYLSLQSEPGAQFLATDEVLEPKPGTVWLFDNRKPHAVKATCLLALHPGRRTN